MVKMVLRVGLLSIFTLAMLSLVSALPSLSPSSFSVNETISNFYNITIQNTESGSANITEANITLPAGFKFISSSEGTSASSITFSNSSSVLRWNSLAFVIQNSATQSFWFNASANTTTIGIFNLTISLVNNTGISYYNITVTVNDTSAPQVPTFVSPSPSNNTHANSASLSVNVSAIDNGQISNVTIYLYNKTANLINNATISSAPFNHTFSSLSEGNYSYNASVFDSIGKINYTETRIVILDTTNASASLSKTSESQTSITVNYSCSDAGSGIQTCTLSSSGGSISSSVISGLSCGTSYRVSVFAKDYANNTKNESSSYSTDSCSSNSSSSSSSSSTTASGGNSSFWTQSYTVSENEFKTGYTQALGAKHRLRFAVGSDLHSVGIVSLSNTKATMNVSSTPQQEIFSIGESNKFDVDDDSFYDVLVTLNDITSSKANVTIIAISEEIKGTSSGSAENKKTDVTTADSSQNNSQSPSAQAKAILANYKAAIISGAAIIIIGLVVVFGRNKILKVFSRK